MQQSRSESDGCYLEEECEDHLQVGEKETGVVKVIIC
ncbi:MAG: hypothetical protein RL623_906 [Actinomycetota bacterium]